MNGATAHISGANLDLLLRGLEKNLARPYVFSSGTLWVFATGKSPSGRENVFTVVVLDFSVPDECQVDIYSGGGANRGSYSNDCGRELKSIGLVLDSIKNISASNGWRYMEQRRLLVYPPDPGA